MLRSRLILLAASVIVVVILFMLPRVVIENDNIITENPADSIARQIDLHADVSPEVSRAIKNLRGRFAADARNEKNAIFADSLADLYAKAGRFDSSAWYAEEASKFFNNTESWVKAGDQNYQAYMFAIDASRQAGFASRAQSFYNKVLAVSPDRLDVKTKLAMTYLTDANPMRAITTLREVLAIDPRHEEALYNMGLLSIQSGQNDKAVERLEQLLKLKPDYAQAHLLLGIAYMNMKEAAKAREQFEKVKLLEKDPAVHATVDTYLKDLK